MEKILSFIIIALSLFVSIASYAEIKPLRIPLHAAKITLDPSGIQDLSSLFVSRQVNCQLVRSYGSVISLEAAQSIHFITPTKILITVKNGMTFHDGSPVTANDVVASLNHLKKSRHTLRNIFNWIKQIEILNQRQISITLIKPVPQFLNVLSSPNYAIFKKEFLANAKNNSDLWRFPLGCGKYKVNESSDRVVKLTPAHHGKSIEFYLNKDDQVISSSIDNYDIVDLHIVGKPGNLAHYRSIELFDPTQIYLGLNTQSNHWKKREDRCSFFAKLDATKVIKQYAGLAKPAADILPEGVLGYRSSLPTLQKLKKQFALINTAKINQFCLSYLTVSVPKEYRAEYQHMIERLYPNVRTTEITNNKRFGIDFINSQCDALIAGIKSNTLDGYDLLAIFSLPDPNFTGYIDKKITKEIEGSQNESDPKSRVLMYRHIVNEIEESCVIHPILTIPMKLVFIRKELHTPNIGKGPFNEYDLSEVYD